ncbi:MAG TPA: allophanate hydrolase subunit 1 [Jatrophihabitans sp.]|nr:allophanate hydrolase subunit 1 [Jatrophihabitans sp.]
MRALPVGEHALLLEVADPGELRALQAHVAALRATSELAEVTDAVPGARTLLLDGLADPAATARRASSWVLPRVAEEDGTVVELDVVYDGEDLPLVARMWGVDVTEAAARHASVTYTVAFSGFAPGFAYLTGLPDELAVPRRDSPRARVPAGSVGLAGSYTGVYPRQSPGGWQLIGHTDAPLWDAAAQPPALLVPGTRVRMRPVA